MKRHCRPISQMPATASNTITILLEGLTQIIDTLLLTQRQLPWKAFFPPGGVDDGGDDGDGGAVV